MNYPSIRIEGSILSPDILEKLEDIVGQRPADFGFEASSKVKDEIARAWADAQEYWRIYHRRLETLKTDSPATTETRNLWIVPLLGLLGYNLEYHPKSFDLNGKFYPISHRITNRGDAALHIIGSREPAGLDRKPELRAASSEWRVEKHHNQVPLTTRHSPKMSAHAMMQEYLNLTDQLYGLVTNGRLLRLLRDSSRLVKLSYLEFDLDRIFNDGLFADFAVFYRLLHVTRLPATHEAAAESLIERYHQDSVDSGARIREGLSKAVERAIRDFGNGFLAHPANDALRAAVSGEWGVASSENPNHSPLTTNHSLTPQEFYSHLLRLIYRLLFLMVIEERNLVFPHGAPAAKRAVYENYYSVQRLRRLSEKRFLADRRHHDQWLSLLATFRLFEDGGPGSKLGIAPLAGDLFSRGAMGMLQGCSLDNATLLGCLRALGLYENDKGQLVRVNYAALNVEEFGSVYEGLLEYEPVIISASGEWRVVCGDIEFAFKSGDERAATGSHYTPDDLVQPLIKHSLDYQIADKLEESRRVANGEWRVVEEPWKSYFRKDVHGILSGSGNLAAGNESGGIRLQIDEILSKGGNVRSHQPDSTGSSLNSGQNSRGVGTTVAKGVSAVSSHSQWQPQGDGNPSTAQQKGGNLLGGAYSTTHQRDSHSQQTDSGAATVALTENQLAELWGRLPLATRHSLLASQALLSLRVADISCGSGHILLAAARRIATELAIVRTSEEQPSPAAFRTAVRDVIRHCIYGVDLNPLAVELCKVALWLEAHIPGQPLNFLDHHIKCGNAIVGFARRDELEKGVPDEAFVTMPGDDKEIAAAFRKRNKEERKRHEEKLPEQQALTFTPEVEKHLSEVLKGWRTIAALPERTPAEIESKKKRYEDFAGGQDAWLLSQIAAIPIAQFYIEKTKENQPKLITDEEYRRYLGGHRTPQGQATAMAWVLANRKRFFHWFLEFPEVIEQGGFDCILGNPPYLGGQDLSGTYGYPLCHYLKWEFAPTGLSDLVVFFVRRIYDLLRPGGFTAFITTNSIKDGDVRKDSLDQILHKGGAINFAVRSVKWPGRANLVVSLVGIYKGKLGVRCFIDNREVHFINTFFDDCVDFGAPLVLTESSNSMFQGSEFLGEGFLITESEADSMRKMNPTLNEVILPTLNGQEINSHPANEGNRWIIFFRDWPLEKATTYTEAIEKLIASVKPEREKQNDQRAKALWWQFKRPTMEIYRKISGTNRCFVTAVTTKHLNFVAVDTNMILLKTLKVFTSDRWDLFTIIQSMIHEVWARKYSGALGSTLRYSPSDCFETFPFPKGLWQTPSPALAELGEHYHEHRRVLMLRLWLGLTDIYNLFHNRDLTPAIVAKVSKKPAEAETGYQGILELRKLHRDLDQAVLAAYGWTDMASGEWRVASGGNSASSEMRVASGEKHLPLATNHSPLHSFYEVETLPENDRVRYTISPAARKELLKRLLALNHQRAEEEKTKAPVKAASGGKRGRKKKVVEEPGLFG